MRKMALICLLAALLVACTPSPSLVATAIAQTQSAAPVPTSTIGPTPTETPIPAPTLDRSSTRSLISSEFASIGYTSVELIDARYEDGARGPRTILLVEAHYSTDTAAAGAGAIIAAVAALTRQAGNFDAGVVALNVVMRDSKMNPVEIAAINWQDVLDFGAKRITTDQLLKRILFTPPLPSTPQATLQPN
jgi:hypothetical protein